MNRLFLYTLIALSACWMACSPRSTSPNIQIDQDSITALQEDEISLSDIFQSLALRDESSENVSEPSQPNQPSIPAIAVSTGNPFALRKQRGAKPRPEVKRPTLDFGFVNEGDTIFHTFHIVNQGKAPWKIEEILPSCGCTGAKSTKLVVPPGESTDISVQFHTAGQPGRRVKLIEVFSNSGYLKLSLEGTVYPKGFTPTPQSAESAAPDSLKD